MRKKNDIVVVMEERLGSDIPPFQEHALNHVIHTHQLSTKQIGILRNHVHFSQSLETILIMIARHEVPGLNVDAASKQFTDSLNQVNRDSQVAQAHAQYEQMIALAQVENEP